ncbi:MAG: hypothetical protein HYZ81_12995 [Nitrospinae bacterium]|nr:hypothetical protein [Nitrospinota bacterium]
MTVKVDDPTLIPEVEALGIQFRGRVESNWLGTLLSWILPALVFVGIWGLVMRRMGAASGLMAIGKSKAKVYVEKATGVTFDSDAARLSGADLPATCGSDNEGGDGSWLRNRWHRQNLHL